MKCFFDRADWNTRVVGGICKAKGAFIYVEGYEDDDIFVCRDLKESKRIRVNKNDLDLSPVQLGNVFTGKAYRYLARTPARIFKQTLSNQALVNTQMPFRDAPQITIENKSLLNCFENNFMTVDKALDMVCSGKAIAAPFSREFGFTKLEGKVKLIHRCFDVGTVSKDKITLDKKFFYLKEVVQEVLNA